MQTNKQKILFPSDFSESSMNAWGTCEAFAKAYDAEIVILYVVEPPTLRFDYEEEPEVMIARKTVNDKVALLNLAQNVQVSSLVKVGKPFKKIIEAALEIDPITIIMGTHGASGFEEFFIGSNASRVIRSASCPIVTVREPMPDGIVNKILLPLDVTKETKEKLSKALELAQKFNATIHVASVANSGDDVAIMTKQLEHVVNYIQNQGISVEKALLETSEDIGNAVLKYAEECEADFICIMTQQEKSIKEYFVGSTAEHIVNRAKIPVVSIRPSNLYISKRLGSIFG